jgi:hypothetical protein
MNVTAVKRRDLLEALSVIGSSREARRAGMKLAKTPIAISRAAADPGTPFPGDQTGDDSYDSADSSLEFTRCVAPVYEPSQISFSAARLADISSRM